MDQFQKVYAHLYASLQKFGVDLEISPDDIVEEKVHQLYPVFRIINLQVERNTVDDHVFLFQPLITEENFFKLTENNRKILLEFVKKLYSIQEKMDIPEPNAENQLDSLLSSLDLSELDTSTEEIQEAASSLGESLGLTENDPLRNIMQDIIQTVGTGLQQKKPITELIQEATQNFQGRLANDMKQNKITTEQIQQSQQKMVQKMEKIMRNPMAAASMLQSEDQKKKAKDERRAAMRKKWRKNNKE